MFVIILKYKKSLEVIDQYLSAHRAYLDTAYQANQLIVSGPQIPRTGGLIVSNFKDKKSVQAFIQNDPYYIQDLSEYEIIEFDPVKYHREFEIFLNKNKDHHK